MANKNKPINEGMIPEELSTITPEEVIQDWDELERLTREADETLRQRDKQKSTLRTDRVRGVNISKIEEVTVLTKTGPKKLQPARIAALARHYIVSMYNDPDTKVLAKFFPKDIIWTFAIPTACTDGIRVAFNPEFAYDLFGKDADLQKAAVAARGPQAARGMAGTAFQFVLIHEVYHQIYQHVRRELLKAETANGQKHALANIAQDVEINRDIEAQMPKYKGCTNAIGGCFDERFNNGEMWEQIFDAYNTGNVTPPVNPTGPQKRGKNPSNKGGQLGQHGGQGSSDGQQRHQDQQGGQQGGSGSQQGGGGQGGGNKPNVEKKSPSYRKGYDDRIRELIDAYKNGTFTPPSFYTALSTNDVFDQAEYDQGRADAERDFQAFLDRIKNGNQNDQQEKDQDGNGNGTGGQNDNNQNGENDGSGNGGFGDDADGSDDSDMNPDQNQVADDAESVYDGDFNDIDVVDGDIMRALAEEAGQPYDMDDINQDPKQKIQDYIEQNFGELSNIGKGKPGAAGGLGQRLTDINKMLKPKINWKRALKSLMNQKSPTGSKSAYSRKYLGSTERDLQDAKYTKPRTKTFEEDNGIAQVFHMIDNSCSMYSQVRGDHEGETIFKQIFSEIVDMEKKCGIQHSCMTFFSTNIDKSKIRRWDYKTPKSTIIRLLNGDGNDMSGGTSLENSIMTLRKIGRPYFEEKGDERTLLIMYTDGEDNYEGFKKLPLSIRWNMVAVIINASQDTLDDAKKRLENVGLKSNRVLCINAKDISNN